MFSKKCREHCKSNGMTPLQHLRFAWGLSFKLMIASIALLIHGLIPRVLQTYGSDTIEHVHTIITRMKAKK